MSWLKFESKRIVKKPRKETGEDAFVSLPSEVFYYILTFLSPRTLSKISRVNKLWCSASKKDIVWKRHAQAKGLSYACDFKDRVVEDIMWTRTEKNIYYLAFTHGGEPHTKKFAIQKDSDLYSNFKGCMEVLKGCVSFGQHRLNLKNYI